MVLLGRNGIINQVLLYLGDIDEPDAIDTPTWYDDQDTDGYGDPAASQRACQQPAGTVSDNTDCDDGDREINPDTVWYLDYDTDGYGDSSLSQTQCAQPARFIRARYRFAATTSAATAALTASWR